MAGVGPPPKPDGQRRRRNATPGTTYLPAEGRQGEAPAWPLGDCDAAEMALWGELWALPQAVAWERQRIPVREVALYARWSLRAEVDIKAAPEARQLADRLGLTPQAMQRLRWEVVPDELADARQSGSAPVERRIRAVE